MKPASCEIVIVVSLVCMLLKQSESVYECRTGGYYSEDVFGCLKCPRGSCRDQDWRDIERCRKACEVKATDASLITRKTTVHTKSTPVTATLPDSVEKITHSTRNRLETDKSSKLSLNDGPSGETRSDGPAKEEINLGLAIILSVAVVFVLCLAFVAYMWQCSRAAHVTSAASEEERMQICAEPSTSSLQSEPVPKTETMDDKCPPVQETDHLAVTVFEDTHSASLLRLEEHVNYEPSVKRVETLKRM